MSKSDDNPNSSIFLLDDEDTITNKFKKAVTDSGTEITFDESRPAIANLLTIYHLLTGRHPMNVLPISKAMVTASSKPRLPTRPLNICVHSRSA
jgi:tryptophanyl-tRNA synthetase